MSKKYGRKRKNKRKKNIISNPIDDNNKQLARSNINDPRLKIYYFIPHGKQNLNDTSPFGWFSPGIHASSRMFLSAAMAPTDIREPFTSREIILMLRMKRLLWRNVIPVDIDAMRELITLNKITIFHVILTNSKDIADQVDRLKFWNSIPFLHVSSIKGKNRLIVDNFNLTTLLQFIKNVLSHLGGIPEWKSFVKATESTLSPKDIIQTESVDIEFSNHNVTTPNEVSLISYHYGFEKESALIPRETRDEKWNPQIYIDRICSSADAVWQERSKLLKKSTHESIDNSYIISVPSIFWGYYKAWNKNTKNRGTSLSKAAKLAFKSILHQESYYFIYKDIDLDEIKGDSLATNLIKSKSADQLCYTSGLALLSSSTLTPVLRLEPKVRNSKSEFNILAHCVRYSGRRNTQLKQSRLARAASTKLKNLVDKRFIDKIEEASRAETIQGLIIAADIPLEWLLCNGIPLGMKFDVSRIPILPGNLYIQQCAIPPSFIDYKTLSNILVLRAFKEDDPLRGLFESALNTFIDKSSPHRNNIRMVDINNVNDMVSEVNMFSGGILIFDGHGSYDSELGIGMLNICGETVDVWELRERCHFPPIVLFSACDTHPLDGGHGSSANAAFTLGARTVLATTLPINGDTAAVFLCRLMLRIFEYVPIALKLEDILTWRHVISGLLRMTYTTEITRIISKYAELDVSEKQFHEIQMAANNAINVNANDWFEVYLNAACQELSISMDNLVLLISKWASITDSQKYIQLGLPENIVITQ